MTNCVVGEEGDGVDEFCCKEKVDMLCCEITAGNDGSLSKRLQQGDSNQLYVVHNNLS